MVGFPIQYHLRAEDQRVIGILADQLLNQKTIGRSYKKLDYEFILDENVHVYIYKKIKPVQPSDIQDLSRMFQHFYPDRKDIFRIDSS